MKEKEKEINLTQYELSYRAYQEGLTTLCLASSCYLNKNNLDKIINILETSNDNNLNMHKNILLVHEQIKKFSKEDLFAKLYYLKASLQSETITTDINAIVGTIKLIKGCLALYSKLQLQ